MGAPSLCWAINRETGIWFQQWAKIEGARRLLDANDVDGLPGLVAAGGAQHADDG